jgi:hypothetical protein
MKDILSNLDNPLPDLISDECYELLNYNILIDEKSIRNIQIRKKFKQLQAKKVNTEDALNTIKKTYPHLQLDTIKKIVYKNNIPRSKKNNES